MFKSNDYKIQLRKEIAKKGNFSYVGIPTTKKTVRVLDEFGYWKLVDLDSKPIIDKVERLSAFVEGRAIVEDGKECDQYDSYFIDEEGIKVSTVPFYLKSSFYPYSPYSEGLAVVYRTMGESKFGYINTKGKLVIPYLFDYACKFSDSVAWARIDHPSPIRSLFYLIDKTGNQIIPYPFSTVNNFVGGVAGVKLFDNYFDPKMRPQNYCPSYVVIDKEGNILSQRFFHIGEFSDGIAIACSGSEGFKQILINKEGKQVSKQTYDNLDFIHEGIYCVSIGNKEFYMDKEENQISQTYDSIQKFSEGLGCVEEKGKFFFIDRNGKKAFSELFDEAKPFDEGVARVIKNRQTFYIDHNGERVF